MNRQFDIAEYGYFDSPRKTIYSPFHQELLVMGDYTVYRFSSLTLQKKPIQVADGNYFSDMDVNSDGHVLLLFRPKTIGASLARVILPNLFQIEYQLVVQPSLSSQWQFQKGVFAGLGKAVVAGELTPIPFEGEGFGMSSSSTSSQSIPQDSGSSSLSSSSSSIVSPNTIRLYVLDYKAKTSFYKEVRVNGAVVGLHYRKDINTVFGVTAGGTFFSLFMDFELDHRVEVDLLEELPVGAFATCSMISDQNVSQQAVAPQESVRVFVGSRPWSNDRWDSGEIASNKQSILYGGGDNLVPGQQYWVHISVKSRGQWSSPQIKPFIVPK